MTRRARVGRFLATLALGVLLGFSASRPWSTSRAPSLSTASPSTAAHLHAGPSIERVRELASLATVVVDVADVQETRLDGYLGGARAALLVKGDAALAVDLSRVTFESLDPSARHAVLALPEPRVSRPRLDHPRTRLFALDERGLWQVVPGGDAAYAAVVNRAYAEAERVIAAAVEDDPELTSRARRQAEAVLRGYFDALGWRLTVRWPDPGRP